jgi:RNA ligase
MDKMKYTFPYIEKIEDVLPHIKDRGEFLVAEREHYTVINYMVALADTFDMFDSYDEGNYVYDVTGAIRRECRGLKFYKDGRIAARPFFKFFNINERDETKIDKVDWSKPYTIMEKRDGSMIHPMRIGNDIRWMTKMGITEVSAQAEKFIEKNTNYEKFAKWCIENQLTPIFEYTSPNNKIVVRYEKDELVLLAVRHNITGEFMDIHQGH